MLKSEREDPLVKMTPMHTTRKLNGRCNELKGTSRTNSDQSGSRPTYGHYRVEDYIFFGGEISGLTIAMANSVRHAVSTEDDVGRVTVSDCQRTNGWCGCLDGRVR